MEPIVNKVAQSPLITLDLEEILNFNFEIKNIDIKDFLFKELIIKEKEFREQLKSIDWQVYKNAIVAIQCSADAIIPIWVYMLFATYLRTNSLFFAITKPTNIKNMYFISQLSQFNYAMCKDKKVVVKGCGKMNIEPIIYGEFTRNLLPFCNSIMYGEPCSTVPIYKTKG